MAKVKVILQGSLASFGNEFELDAFNVAQVINGLSKQLPGFGDAMSEGAWTITADGGEDRSDALLAVTEDTTITISPALTGEKGGGGLGKIAAGGALIAASYFSGGLAAGASGMLAAGAHAGFSIGLGMALMGTSQVLYGSQVPNYENNNSNKKANTNFEGPVNSAGQGMPIPIIIGRRILAGSVVVSAGIHTGDVA